MTNKTILLAAGGTGGHIFPALALAEELTAAGYNPILITDSRYNNYQITTIIQVKIIASDSISGNLIKKIKGLMRNILGFCQAVKLMKITNPVLVVGFGGYPSFPTMVAAVLFKIKTIIHEPNAVLGKANSYLANHVDIIAAGFTKINGVSNQNQHKLKLVVNPVRAAIAALQTMPYPQFTKDGKLNLLITGGSQGASIFSQIIPASIAKLNPIYSSRLIITQQCREADLISTQQFYLDHAICAELKPFFTDMGQRLSAAQLVIARAGAGTIAELQLAKKPAILVPYPNSYLNHQFYNAERAAELGFAWNVSQNEFTVDWLAAKLTSFFEQPELLNQAAKQASVANSQHEETLLSLTLSKDN